jgi:hypothetical protein
MTREKPTHKKHTLKNRFKPDDEPKFLKECFSASQEKIELKNFLPHKKN